MSESESVGYSESEPEDAPPCPGDIQLLGEAFTLARTLGASTYEKAHRAFRKQLALEDFQLFLDQLLKAVKQGRHYRCLECFAYFLMKYCRLTSLTRHLPVLNELIKNLRVEHLYKRLHLSRKHFQKQIDRWLGTTGRKNREQLRITHPLDEEDPPTTLDAVFDRSSLNMRPPFSIMVDVGLEKRIAKFLESGIDPQTLYQNLLFELEFEQQVRFASTGWKTSRLKKYLDDYRWAEGNRLAEREQRVREGDEIDSRATCVVRRKFVEIDMESIRNYVPEARFTPGDIVHDFESHFNSKYVPAAESGTDLQELEIPPSRVPKTAMADYAQSWKEVKELLSEDRYESSIDAPTTCQESHHEPAIILNGAKPRRLLARSLVPNVNGIIPYTVVCSIQRPRGKKRYLTIPFSTFCKWMNEEQAEMLKKVPKIPASSTPYMMKPVMLVPGIQRKFRPNDKEGKVSYLWCGPRISGLRSFVNKIPASDLPRVRDQFTDPESRDRFDRAVAAAQRGKSKGKPVIQAASTGELVGRLADGCFRVEQIKSETAKGAQERSDEGWVEGGSSHESSDIDMDSGTEL